MIVKAELEFEVPDNLPKDLVEEWGCSLATYIHDGVDIAFNRKDVDAPLFPCKLVGIRALHLSSGTLCLEEENECTKKS